MSISAEHNIIVMTWKAEERTTPEGGKTHSTHELTLVLGRWLSSGDHEVQCGEIPACDSDV